MNSYVYEFGCTKVPDGSPDAADAGPGLACRRAAAAWAAGHGRARQTMLSESSTAGPVQVRDLTYPSFV